MLAFVPSGADAELAPAVRQQVEGRDGLGEEPGVAVRHAGDEQPEPDRLGVRGEEPEGRVALHHRFGRGRQRFHLEPVVHDADVGEAGFLRRVADRGEGGTDRGGAAGEVPGDDVQSDLHAVSFPVGIKVVGVRGWIGRMSA